MKLRLLVPALSSCLLAACADDAPNANPPRLYDITDGNAMVREAARAVVRIQHPAGISGTGSFISSTGLMLTNNHVLGSESCAREGCAITLSFDHQRGEPALDPLDAFAVPIAGNVGLDMAVLQVYQDKGRRKELRTADFLRIEPRTSKELIGAHVTTIGHPLGRLKKWSAGVVIDDDGGWFESTVFSLPGSSGSPIVDDEGRIVGLLHRGTDGFDLLTRTSSLVSAIASSSAALEQAMGDPLPASVISVEDELSAAQVLAASDAFLASSTLEAQIVGGSPTPLLELFAQACDEGLAREDYTSLEALSAGLRPCLTAIDFIECRGDSEESDSLIATTCPDDVMAWKARLAQVMQRQLEFNGSLDLSPVSFSLEVLADSEEEGKAEAQQAINEALEQ
ncbi:MAG TPA: serine protease, partial [Polyangiales bacterium]|nr:serine protease [Polyangiales bacterium]